MIVNDDVKLVLAMRRNNKKNAPLIAEGIKAFHAGGEELKTFAAKMQPSNNTAPIQSDCKLNTSEP